MHRFYMTAETRQALIVESNRLIAERAASTASRLRARQDGAEELHDAEWAQSQGGRESAFDRLVSELLRERHVATQP